MAILKKTIFSGSNISWNKKANHRTYNSTWEQIKC